MRAITKGAQPHELIRWRADNAALPQNLIYGAGAFPGEAVRNSLLAEQLHLCAYTMRQLKTAAQCQVQGLDTRASCHIEHFLPQCRKVPGEDIDYQNMVACFPPSQSNVACDFGAHAKADFDPSNGGFVSPLSPAAGASVATGSVKVCSASSRARGASLKIASASRPRSASSLPWMARRRNDSPTCS